MGVISGRTASVGDPGLEIGSFFRFSEGGGITVIAEYEVVGRLSGSCLKGCSSGNWRGVAAPLPRIENEDPGLEDGSLYKGWPRSEISAV